MSDIVLDLVKSLLSAEPARRAHPRYRPIPEEIQVRLEVLHHVCWWGVVKAFPFGGPEFPAKEQIETLTLRRYPCDASGMPKLMTPLGDHTIFFGPDGVPTRYRYVDNRGKVRADVRYTLSKREWTVDLGHHRLHLRVDARGHRFLTTEPVTSGDGSSYEIDNLGRVLTTQGSPTFKRRFDFDPATGLLHELRYEHEKYEERYTFTWKGETPVSGIRTKCTGDASQCSPKDLRSFAFRMTEANRQLVQVREFRNTSTGAVYSTETDTCAFDDRWRLVHSSRHSNAGTITNTLSYEGDELTRWHYQMPPLSGSSREWDVFRFSNEAKSTLHVAARERHPVGIYDLPARGDCLISRRPNGNVTNIVFRHRNDPALNEVVKPFDTTYRGG